MRLAYEMAVDALGLAIMTRKEENKIIPEPTQPDEIATEEGISVLVCTIAGTNFAPATIVIQLL